MNGSKYIVGCPKCKSEIRVRGRAMTLAMTCSTCGVYFRIGHWNKTVTNFSTTKEIPAIPIGSKGRIDGTVYEVLGFVVKREVKYRYQWREYLLFNPFLGFAFLSEYNGNWNFLWPVEDDPRGGSVDSNFRHEGYGFNLYQKYRAEVVHAQGEFFFDVVDITESTLNLEYIAPPFVFGNEVSDDSFIWYKGEYFSRQEVADAFKLPVNKLPRKQGMGYTQPVSASFSEKSLIALSILIMLLVLVMQLFFTHSAEEKIVYQGEFKDADLKDQKFFVTPSFEFNGGSKSVEFNIFAPLSNNWFFAEFALINEATGTEYNFTKDIEYYHGYEDGYSWSEGSTYGEAFLSRIPEGKYHVNIYPDFSSGNREFSLNIKRDIPTSSNFFITWLGLALFPAGYYIRKRMLEKKRWSESDYSPYE